MLIDIMATMWGVAAVVYVLHIVNRNISRVVDRLDELIGLEDTDVDE